MQIPFCSLYKGYAKYTDEYKQAAIRVLDSGWYVLGEELRAFETEFSSWLGVENCVGVNSGLDALTLAVRALGINTGDEVIVPANTYIASVLAITENGATPTFAEPNGYYNIDTDKLDSLVTSKTKALLVVHLYGQPCNMEAVMRIAEKYNLYVIEDCAQSHGATFNKQKTGTFGIVSCFSFFPTKNLGAFGDAGAVVTDDKEIAEKVRMYRNYGSERKYYNKTQGINSRMDEMQAALLRVKLCHLEELTQERESIAETYLNGIKHPMILKPGVMPGVRAVWHQFVIRTKYRDHLISYLSNKGISTQIHYPIPPHLAEAYSYLGYRKGDFPITESYADSILSLPMYNGISHDELQYVVDSLNNWDGGEQR